MKARLVRKFRGFLAELELIKMEFVIGNLEARSKIGEDHNASPDPKCFSSVNLSTTESLSPEIETEQTKFATFPSSVLFKDPRLVPLPDAQPPDFL